MEILFVLVQFGGTSGYMQVEQRIYDDVGAIVDKVTKFSFPKDEKQAPRFPKVIFTDEERRALKELRPPGEHSESLPSPSQTSSPELNVGLLYTHSI